MTTGSQHCSRRKLRVEGKVPATDSTRAALSTRPRYRPSRKNRPETRGSDSLLLYPYVSFDPPPLARVDHLRSLTQRDARKTSGSTHGPPRLVRI